MIICVSFKAFSVFFLNTHTKKEKEKKKPLNVNNLL